MRRPFSALLLLATSAPATWAQDTNAVWLPCTTPIAVKTAFDQASLILVGKVVQSQDYQERLVTDTSRTTWRMHRVVLKALRGWKGQPRDTIIFVTPPPDQDTNTIRFEPDHVYLVYLRSELDATGRTCASTAGQILDLLWDRPDFIRCSRSARLAAASEDLQFLGPAHWVRP